jgi:hypothetical protein
VSVYSTSFFVGPHSGAGANVYTVPAGQTVVVRDMECYNGGSSATIVEIGTTMPGSGYTPFWHLEALGATTWAQWQGRVVMASGSITVATGGATCYFTVSGYLLSP